MNAIYWFSGTGNSLHVARQLAQRLSDCELRHINALHQLPRNCERIGFVFPHYALGVPNLVRKKLEDMAFSDNQSAYFFAVETCGAFPGNCLAQVRDLLKLKGVQLHYGRCLPMFANNVVNYDMKSDATERAQEADQAAQQIAEEIQQRAQNHIPRTKHMQALIYRRIVATYPKKGLGFHASETCVGCGLCAKVCPAQNIALQNGKLVFGDHCEQCMACIQWCPQQAINYKGKTQGRSRYHHPEVTAQELIGGD